MRENLRSGMQENDYHEWINYEYYRLLCIILFSMVATLNLHNLLESGKSLEKRIQK